LPVFQLMHDLRDYLGWPTADIDGDRMLVRPGFLQGRKLAVD
jgi:hypothetical protein